MIRGKLVCEKEVSGEMRLMNITTVTGLNVGSFLKTTPGVGKPFWWWPSIPAGKLVGCDFSAAPIVTDDTETNNAEIAVITTQPSEVLVYQA